MRRSSGTKPRPMRGHVVRLAVRDVAAHEATACPCACRACPSRAFSVVDLPAPLRPISATTSPRRTCRSTSNRICAAPYQARQASRRRAAARRRLARTLMTPASFAASLSRRSCRCRSRPPAPSDGRGSRPACLAAIRRPARQHDHAVGVGEHHVHAVLGEQHRHAALDHQLLGQRHQLVALLRRHAGGGLVHQQQLRACWPSRSRARPA